MLPRAWLLDRMIRPVGMFDTNGALLEAIWKNVTVIRDMKRYLVDPAWTDVFISKIKPCMYKYKRFKRETANGSLQQL